MSEVEEAIEQIRRALIDKGPMPNAHVEIAQQTRAAWPSLMNGVDRLMAATNPSGPPPRADRAETPRMYQGLALADIRGGCVTSATCLLCGAMVINEAKHTDWHARNGS